MRTKLLWGVGSGVSILLVIAIVSTGGSFGSGSLVTSEGDTAAGETVFENTCAACHGVEGIGTEQGPPLVHQYYRPGHHADGAFTLGIRNGVQPHHWDFGPMPPQPGLSAQDIADVTAYVRQVQINAGIS
jgi:mono/diheme cytochrome c family protein